MDKINHCQLWSINIVQSVSMLLMASFHKNSPARICPILNMNIYLITLDIFQKQNVLEGWNSVPCHSHCITITFYKWETCFTASEFNRFPKLDKWKTKFKNMNNTMGWKHLKRISKGFSSWLFKNDGSFPTALDFSHPLYQFIGLYVSGVSPRVQWSYTNNDKRWGFQTATRQATNSACHLGLNVLTRQELTGITRKIAR